MTLQHQTIRIKSEQKKSIKEITDDTEVEGVSKTIRLILDLGMVKVRELKRKAQKEGYDEFKDYLVDQGWME